MSDKRMELVHILTAYHVRALWKDRFGPGRPAYAVYYGHQKTHPLRGASERVTTAPLTCAEAKEIALNLTITDVLELFEE